MSDDEDLHGQVLRFSGVSPMAGGGADNTQSLQQHTRGDIAAAQIGQLPRFWQQSLLRQNLQTLTAQSQAGQKTNFVDI